MKSFGLTDKGKVRRDNQDSYLIELCPVSRKGCIVASVCDGMGGEKAGALASQLANKAFADYIFDKLLSPNKKYSDYESLLMSAVKTANRTAYTFSQFGEEYRGMGTTLVGGIIENDGKCHIVNVGDSRAYHISHRGSIIRQITQDHSYVQELVDAGVITEEQARFHPRRNMITRALGSDDAVKADYFNIELKAGDYLVLCSDGLYNTVSDDEIALQAKSSKEPEAICHALMDMALLRGAKDNVTIAVIRK